MTEAARWAGILIEVSGLLQLGVALGSMAVPRLLHWNAELARLSPLIRQLFWTYAVYIFGTNLFFAGLSITMASSLAGGSRLSMALCSFVACYWAGRLVIQFFYFDKKALPKSGIYRYGEWLLVAGFAFFTVVYGGTAIAGYMGLLR